MPHTTALLVANSILPAPRILAQCRNRADLVICADGGANRARASGLQPDYIVGDLDSLREETRREFPHAAIISRPSQYASDLEKSFTFALEQGVTRALLVGVTGLRFDHTLVNLNIAEKFCDRLEIEMHDDYGMGTFIAATQSPVTKKIATFIGQQITLLAFRRVEGITTAGLKYPLHHEALEWAVRDGLSNEALAAEIAITVRHGTLFCYFVRDDAVSAE